MKQTELQQLQICFYCLIYEKQINIAVTINPIFTLAVGEEVEN